MDMYKDKTDHYYGQGRPEMLQFLGPSPGDVLEIGCGAGVFAARLKDRYPESRVTAVEPIKSAAALARGRVDELIEGDFEQGCIALAGRAFDTIVMNDVLEHLLDPWDVLKRLKKQLKPDVGRIIVSLPNVRYFPVFKDYVANGQWCYQDEGVMDRTHLRFFTKRSIADIFEASGYCVDLLQGINPTELTWKIKVINILTGGSLDDLRYMQYACVARPL